MAQFSPLHPTRNHFLAVRPLCVAMRQGSLDRNPDPGSPQDPAALQGIAADPGRVRRMFLDTYYRTTGGTDDKR